MYVKSLTGKRSRPSLNIIHLLTRSAVRTWSTVTRLRTHNSTVPRTELQQSKCFTEHEYRCAQRSILRPTGELKWPYITPYHAIELTRVLWCAFRINATHSEMTRRRLWSSCSISMPCRVSVAPTSRLPPVTWLTGSRCDSARTCCCCCDVSGDVTWT